MSLLNEIPHTLKLHLKIVETLIDKTAEDYNSTPKEEEELVETFNLLLAFYGLLGQRREEYQFEKHDIALLAKVGIHLKVQQLKIARLEALNITLQEVLNNPQQDTIGCAACAGHGWTTNKEGEVSDCPFCTPAKSL